MSEPVHLHDISPKSASRGCHFPRPGVVTTYWYIPCMAAAESKPVSKKENNMKRITLFACAAALLTTPVFSQSPAAPPSGGGAPSQPQSPQTPAPGTPTSPGQRDTLPPGQPYGSSTNAGAARTNNVGAPGSGSLTNAGGITNRTTPPPYQPAQPSQPIP
jgi:hypothetical protein